MAEANNPTTMDADRALDAVAYAFADIESGIVVFRDILNTHCSVLGPSLDGQFSFLLNAFEGICARGMEAHNEAHDAIAKMRATEVEGLGEGAPK